MRGCNLVLSELFFFNMRGSMQIRFLFALAIFGSLIIDVITYSEFIYGQSPTNGPVVFPANAVDNVASNKNTFVIIPKNYQINDHPYVKLAKKNRHKQAGRFANEDRRSNAQALRALTKQGYKVLKVPPERLGKDHVPLSKAQQKKNYAFSYKVVDQASGDDFSHSQIRNAKTTNGEYRVKLPDGRIQIVSYTADKNGYKADVRYMRDGLEMTNHENIGHQDHFFGIQRIPVRHLKPIKSSTKQVYHNNHHHDPLPDKLNPVIATELSSHYDTSASTIVTPTSGYLNEELKENKNLQVPLPINVKIITTNARDYSIGYIPVTVTPRYFLKDEKLHSTPHISAQIIHNGDNGIVVPSTPSSFVLTDHHGQVIDNIKLVTSTPAPLIDTTWI